MEVSQNVIATDRRLDKAAERCTEELAAHRWHWTKDETNPKRVSIRAYARAVGRGFTTIQKYATGYALWLETDHDFVISECLERAQVGAETAAAIDAVAKAGGNSFHHSRQHQADTVRTVRAMAEHRAERRKTTVAEELEGAAEALVKGRKADANERSRRKSEKTLQFIEVEGDIAYAMRKLRHALDTAQGVDFTAEHRELLAHSLDTLRAALDLIDLAITGTTKIDWDAELAKLDGAA